MRDEATYVQEFHYLQTSAYGEHSYKINNAQICVNNASLGKYKCVKRINIFGPVLFTFGKKAFKYKHSQTIQNHLMG